MNLGLILTIAAYLGVFVVVGLAFRSTLWERREPEQHKRELA